MQVSPFKNLISAQAARSQQHTHSKQHKRWASTKWACTCNLAKIDTLDHAPRNTPSKQGMQGYKQHRCRLSHTQRQPVRVGRIKWGGGRSPPYCLTLTGMRRSRPNGSARTPQGSPTWLCKPAPKLRGEQPAQRQTQLGHCKKADSCCKCSSMLQTICRTNPANYTSQDLQVMQAGKTWLGPLGARHSTVLKNTV